MSNFYRSVSLFRRQNCSLSLFTYTPQPPLLPLPHKSTIAPLSLTPHSHPLLPLPHQSTNAPPTSQEVSFM